jgi:glucosamine--fructose-6-phosphate aminotransferase (isomerizing)
MAREAALKLKEICGLQAEAYSTAEFLHGPVALIRPNYPVLVFTPADEAAAGVRQLCCALSAKGSHLLVADNVHTAGVLLPVLPPEQPEADALCLIQSFYVMAVKLAAQLGVDVDRPPHLHKITRTT